MEPISAQDWTRRYATASATYNDTAQMVGIAQQIHALATETTATAQILANSNAYATVKRVGMFAGTFNPVTLAHVALVEAAQQKASLEQIIWTCALASIDKELVERATLADRLAQLMVCAHSVPGTAVALVNRGLYVEQVAALKAHFAPETEMFVVVGYDKIMQIFDPQYYEDRNKALDELFTAAHILVAPRGTTTKNDVTDLLNQPQNHKYANGVQFLPVPTDYHDDSSTVARQLAAHPDATAMNILRQMLPPEGVALAYETKAYLPESDDYYYWRSKWVMALLPLPNVAIAHLPALDTLCQLAKAADERGDRIRAWLASPQEQRERQDVLSLL